MDVQFGFTVVSPLPVHVHVSDKSHLKPQLHQWVPHSSWLPQCSSVCQLHDEISLKDSTLHKIFLLNITHPDCWLMHFKLENTACKCTHRLNPPASEMYCSSFCISKASLSIPRSVHVPTGRDTYSSIYSSHKQKDNKQSYGFPTALQCLTQLLWQHSYKL